MTKKTKPRLSSPGRYALRQQNAGSDQVARPQSFTPQQGKQKRRRFYVTKTIALRPREPKLVSRKEFSEIRKLLLTLQTLSQNLVSEVDVPHILEEILKTLGQALRAVWVNIWELTPDGKALVIRQGYGRKGTESYIAHSREHPLKLGVAFIGRAIKTKKTWTSSDMWIDPHLPRSWVRRVKEQNFRAIICTPQIVESAKVIGGMCVYFDAPRVFSDLELRLVAIAANQAAVAIVNANIYNELLAERNKTLAMINSLNEGIILYDNEGRILHINPKAEELLWVKVGEVIKKVLTEGDAAKNIFIKNVYHLGNLTLADFETKEYTTEGPHVLALEVTSIPVHEANFVKIGSMRILRDITREKAVDLLKLNFISTASHQMRTPLSAIRWALDSLRKGEHGTLVKSQQELINEVYDSSVRLVELLTDLLNISRMEEGKFGYTFKAQNILPVLERILRDAAVELRERKLALALEKPDAPLPKVLLDEKNFSLALRNILDNAIRYSRPGGKIRISVDASSGHLILAIKDEGIGIPEESQKFIFVKFFRAENARLFQPEGSGLGLYIAKQIIEKHNGRLTFESKENQGSTFYVHLPISPEKKG